jgi:hypothetical protein
MQTPKTIASYDALVGEAGVKPALFGGEPTEQLCSALKGEVEKNSFGSKVFYAVIAGKRSEKGVYVLGDEKETYSLSTFAARRDHTSKNGNVIAKGTLRTFAH